MPANLAPGAKAPTFKLPSDDGGTVSLADFKGKKLVIYFYPRADTPGCTKESIDFSRHKSAFSRAICHADARAPATSQARLSRRLDPGVVNFS